MNDDQSNTDLQAPIRQQFEQQFKQQFKHLAYVTEPRATASFKMLASDFKVSEELDFELDGSGPHVWLYIQKQGLNTLDIVKRLADCYQVAARDIGYSGMKDKHAITEQWFSLPSIADIDESMLATSNIQVLRLRRHAKKLKRGVHKNNQFAIRLTQLQGDKPQLEAAIQRAAECGVPNYFGPQRFGHDANNLIRAMRWFEKGTKVNRHNRSIFLSAARSWVFNQQLSARVQSGSWNQIESGDVMMLDGSNSIFTVDEMDDELMQRLLSMDIHPSGLLPGRHKGKSNQLSEVEQQVLAKNAVFVKGLEQAGVKASRRALRLRIAGLTYQWISPGELELCFALSKGVFATSVLREIVKLPA